MVFIPRWHRYKSSKPAVSDLNLEHHLARGLDLYFANPAAAESLTGDVFVETIVGDSPVYDGESAIFSGSGMLSFAVSDELSLVRDISRGRDHTILIGLSTTNSTDFRYVFAEDRWDSGENFFQYIENGFIKFHIRDAGWSYNFVLTGPFIADGNEHTVAVKYQNETRQHSLFVDGQFYDSSTPGSDPTFWGGYVFFGGRSGAAESERFDGRLFFIDTRSDALLDEELEELTFARYQILKPRRNYYLLSNSVAANDLSANAKSTTKTTAQINADISVVSASAATSTSNAAISAQLDLSGISASISNANGQLSADVAITAAALVKSLSNATIDLSALIQTQSNAKASGNASLSTEANADLSATGSSSADTDATLSLNATLSGIAVSNALTQANISTGQGLSANSNSSASGSGILLVDVPVSGQTKSYVKVSGGLSAIVPVVSSSASASNVTGGLNVSANLSALALANALIAAGLTVDENGSLSATSKSSADTDAVINLQIPLSVNALANASTVGALSQGTANIPQIDRWTVTAQQRRYSVCA
ncbi:MAG: hypothetical protein GQ532_08955 [Methylomarinum sp.]|nr:hypothetical protein [Methylomarinum sp.]